MAVGNIGEFLLHSNLNLDTILTSFPRRWGRSKNDPSGLHKILRDNLNNEPHFTSVYDLALFILDQCSQVFFDRTRPSDNRPEVMDIFASSIGETVCCISI